MNKIPLMLVVGDREAEAGTVALRLRTAGDVGTTELEPFIRQASAWAASRSLTSPWDAAEASKE